MNNEIWKPIKGYEGLYEISSFGNVKSLPRLVKGIKYEKHYEFPIEGQPLKQAMNYNGYLKVSLSKNGKRKQFLVHRLVAQNFIGDITNKEVDHINTIKADNRVENLRIVTSKENSNNPLSKLHRANAGFGDAAKKVRCIFNDGSFKDFKSITDAFEKGYATSISGVSGCCHGHHSKHNGKIWKFV